MNVTGVLHVGAHLGEEAPLYESLGITNVTWIEGNAAVLPKLEQALRCYKRCYGQRIIHALVHEKDGLDVEFNVTNYDGMSSSIFEFGTHPTFSPDTVFVDRVTMQTTTIDTIVQENSLNGINLLNMDLQGAELLALRGARRFLLGMDYVMLEVNRAEVYVGCAQVEQLDEFLGEFDLHRVETHWVGTQDWGDALYTRKTR